MIVDFKHLYDFLFSAPSTSGCIGNYEAQCSATTKCCDPGAVCDLSKSYPQCRQLSLNSGLCANPTGF
eukprot:gene32211-41752_t